MLDTSPQVAGTLGSKVAMVLEPPAELPWVGGVSEETRLLPATHTSA